MAAPDEGRKRTWRFRLDDATTLEVSSPPRATEKQVRRRGRVSLVLGTLIAALMVSAAASADQLDAEADASLAAVPHGLSTSATQTAGTTAAYDFSAQILDTTPNMGPSDNDVFEVAGGCATAPCVVNVSITRGGDWLATSPDAGQPASFAFTTYNTQQAGTIRVTVPLGTPCGTTKTMTVALGATATNGRALNPSSRNLSYIISTPACAGNTAPTVEAGGPYGPVAEGTGQALSASVTDPDDTPTLSWSAVEDPAYNDVDNGASCSFSPSNVVEDPTVTCNDDGHWLLTLTADDGTNDPVVDTASLEVTNAQPVISAVAFAGNNANVSCGTNNASLTVTFADAGSNDTHKVEIDWDNDGVYDETVDPYTSETAVGHTYATAGQHTAKVRVTDDDNGVSTTTPTASLWVNYNLSAILQPVNDTRNGQPSSIFKYGSTVPTKVEITDCDGSHPSDLDVRVFYAKISGTPPTAGVDENAPATQPDTGNQMRFSDPIYVFNWSTKKVDDPTCTVRLTVKIYNGSSPMQSTYSDIGLKK